MPKKSESNELKEFISLIAIIVILLLLDQFNKFLKSPETYIAPIVSIVKNLLIIVIFIVAVYLLYKYITKKDANNIELTPYKSNEKTQIIFENTNNEEINEVEDKIRGTLRNFKPNIRVKNYNEDVLEAVLYEYLGGIFGKENIKYQQRSKTGTPDIVIYDEYAIELKLTGSIRHVRSYMHQYIGYGEEFSKVFIVVNDKNRKIQEYDRKEFEDTLNKFQTDKFEIIII